MGTIKQVATARVAEWRQLSWRDLTEYADVKVAVAGSEGEGPDFLRRIRDDLAERVEWLIDNEPESLSADYLSDLAHEVADAAVPVYTDDVWGVFCYLRAWDVDDEGLIVDSGEIDLTRMAMTAVYVVARRVADRLLDELVADLTDGVTVTA